MSVSPQINEDLFGNKVFTIYFTLREYPGQVRPSFDGVFEVTSDGGATINNSGTRSIEIIGTQAQCNTAMANLIFIPNADITSTISVHYRQSDDNGDGTPGSNLVEDVMLMTVRDTHDEFMSNDITLAPGQMLCRVDQTVYQITDERPDNIDSNIQYDLQFSMDVFSNSDNSASMGTPDLLYNLSETATFYNDTNLSCISGNGNIVVLTGSNEHTQTSTIRIQIYENGNLIADKLVGSGESLSEESVSIMTQCSYDGSIIPLARAFFNTPESGVSRYVFSFLERNGNDYIENEMFSFDSPPNEAYFSDNVMMISENANVLAIRLQSNVVNNVTRIYEKQNDSYVFIDEFPTIGKLTRDGRALVDNESLYFRNNDGIWELSTVTISSSGPRNFDTDLSSNIFTDFFDYYKFTGVSPTGWDRTHEFENPYGIRPEIYEFHGSGNYITYEPGFNIATNNETFFLDFENEQLIFNTALPISDDTNFIIRSDDLLRRMSLYGDKVLERDYNDDDVNNTQVWANPNDIFTNGVLLSGNKDEVNSQINIGIDGISPSSIPVKQTQLTDNVVQNDSVININRN